MSKPRKVSLSLGRPKVRKLLTGYTEPHATEDCRAERLSMTLSAETGQAAGKITGEIIEGHILQRISESDDIVDALLFLERDLAREVTARVCM